MNISKSYFQLSIPLMDQVQENQLLHLIQKSIPFSREIISFFDQENNKHLLLLKKSSTNNTLTSVFSELKERKISKEKTSIILNNICQKITQQLLYLEENLIEANLAFLKPEMIFVCETYKNKIFENISTLDKANLANHEKLNHITWFILPNEISFESEPKLQGKNIWQYFAEIDPDNGTSFRLLEQLITEKKYKTAFESCITFNFDQNKEFNSKSNSDISEKENTKKQKSKKEKNKVIKKSNFKRWLERLKYKFGSQDIELREMTIPLNPKQDLFRIAMLSEGVPGTLDEDQGIRVFILIDEFLIGRDKAICDLVFEENTIGRLHARITRHGSHYFIEDLGSKNGTYLDGKKLNKYQTYLLPEQCRLKFAEQNLYFIID